ncbi:MAG: hypothetical protein HUJ31_08795 [Pseudomonadales bacterium]|nr:hypothetical protein [Pseudomonadales bacterium]
MYQTEDFLFLFVVISVVLFLFLGTAMIIIIDHKARIPGGFKNDPFTISGMRRDHPVLAFLTTTILLAIIGSLLFEITVTLGEPLFAKTEAPKILQDLNSKRMTEKLRHFHNEPEVNLVTLGKKSVCFYCHGDYPHSKEPMVRTLLNMHTQFIGCMTCHTDPDKVDESSLEFEWLNFSGIEVEGPPFGTDTNPDTGDLIETDDYYSQIVAYRVKDGQKQLLEMPETSDEAREFIEIRESLSDQDRDALKKSFHKLIIPKGRFCSRCHAPEEESFLPFRELGFSDQRVTDVTNLNIIGITQKYKKFYMPNLVERQQDLPDVDKLVGPEHEEAIEAKSEDPEAWWRDSFDQPVPEN